MYIKKRHTSKTMIQLLTAIKTIIDNNVYPNDDYKALLSTVQGPQGYLDRCTSFTRVLWICITFIRVLTVHRKSTEEGGKSHEELCCRYFDQYTLQRWVRVAWNCATALGNFQWPAIESILNWIYSQTLSLQITVYWIYRRDSYIASGFRLKYPVQLIRSAS